MRVYAIDFIYVTHHLHLRHHLWTLIHRTDRLHHHAHPLDLYRRLIHSFHLLYN